MILASGSPRRRELLKLLVDDFQVIESSYEEDNSLNMPPHELVMKHAREKARDVQDRYNDKVIGADSIVFSGKVMGKPHTKEKAREMLNEINGRWIDVYTGVCVIDDKETTEYEHTRVKIAEMTEEEIEWYVQTGEPLDRAGAFAAQGRGAIFIEKINGCFFNVVGLPMFKLKNMLY